MIKKISADNASFKTVEFHSGFNVILADRVDSSTDKDSRNGVGKSSLIDVIHFCLGSSPGPNKGLRIEELLDWTFQMDITLKGKEFHIERNTKKWQIVIIKGDFSEWSIQPEYDPNLKKFTLKNEVWNAILGQLMFDIPVAWETQKFVPSFRSMISYFIRKGVSSFQVPFKQHPQQKEWDIQVNNAFLLGLNSEYPSQLQLIKDKGKALRELKKAAEDGLLTDYFGTMGELEAERVRLEEVISETSERLKSFNVHPEYYEIQKTANRYTKEIQSLLNEININQQLLDRYQDSLGSETDVSTNYIEQVYKEAGLQFSIELIDDISKVKDFHAEVIKNRKNYLGTEIEKLSNSITADKKKVEELSDKRAELLKILDSHGALDEHHKLTSWCTENQKAYNEIINRVASLRKFEEGKGKLKIEKTELVAKMRADYLERQEVISKSIRIFNQNSQALYNEPGVLAINIRDKGYDFDIDIKRSRSQGIGYMKTFCYDMTLSMLRSESPDSPGILIHDSTIFDGVDERQVAKALQLVYKQSGENKFQYICTLNSDIIPYDDFPTEFKKQFDSSIAVRFTDATEDGGLFGKRF